MLEQTAWRGRRGSPRAILGTAFLLLTLADCGGEASGTRLVPVEPSHERGGEAGAQGATDPPLSTTAGVGGAAGGGAGGEEPGGAAGAAPRECSKTADNSGGHLELVSLSRDCAASDGDAVFSRLTPDGRFVVFDSDAGDLVANDLNGTSDVFLYDLRLRRIELISKHPEELRSIEGYSWLGVPSRDARYVAFTSMTYELVSSEVPEGTWVYLKDRESGSVRRFSAGYACTYWLDMSDDARFVVAEGFSNCRGDVKDGERDSSVEYDVGAGLQRALGGKDGSDDYRPAISSDGRFVLWASRPAGTRGQRTSVLQLFDRQQNSSQTLPVYGYHFGSTAISDDGNIVAFSDNGQIYRFDLETSDLQLVSHSSSGGPAERASYALDMSADGRFVVFESTGADLVEADNNAATDVFLFDAQTESLSRLSVGPDGTEADDDSGHAAISADGTHVSFVSKARNLLPAANTGNWQLYVSTLPP